MTVLSVLFPLFGALAPAAGVAWLLWWSDKDREPGRWVVGTFVAGFVGAFGAFFVAAKAASIAGLTRGGNLEENAAVWLFLFGVLAPLFEASKVAATWPAFRSRHFDEPYDGVVYAGVAGLGFAAAEGAALLFRHPGFGVPLVRALLAIPAHLFFSATWGYALGRAKKKHEPGPLFPATWFLSMLMHGLYMHFLFGRGAGAILAVAPLLLTMGVVAYFAARDLAGREKHGILTDRTERAAMSLLELRAAIRTDRGAVRLGWVAFGTFVTLGAILVAFAGSIAAAQWAHIDFARVDEGDLSTVGPAAFLGAGTLLAFPIAGFLLARASELRNLLEPALAAGFALLILLGLLGFAAHVAFLFVIACSPIAWGLACAGAWLGRPSRMTS